MTAPLSFSTQLTVDMPPERLWQYVSDTDRLNRALGLPSVSYEPTESHRMATANLGPIKLRWQEMPFEWVRNEGFSVERIYESGPIARAVAGCGFLEAEENKTKIEIFGHFHPRGAIGSVVARIFGWKMLRDLSRQVRHFEACEAGKSQDPYRRSETRAPINEDALLAGAMRIEHELKKRILGKFLEYLKAAWDEEIIRMRPFELADQWGENRLDVLRTFLAATVAGIVDMKWTPTCPHCRGVKGETATLRDIKMQSYCDGCRMKFDLNFDEAVEVRFTVHPEIRATVDSTFCVGGPANTKHIVLQARIPAGETRTISVDLPRNRFRIRSPQVNGYAHIEWVESVPQTPEFIARPEGFLPETCLYTGNTAEFRVANQTGSEMLFILEEEAWEEKAASAALVTSLQDFRDLFDSEVLSGETELSIRSLSILFSDLKSSTELYEKIGDARAYSLVREHFAFMAERIAERNGAIVKTIGDSVMAVFVSARDAVETALDIQNKITEFNRRENLPSAITLKLGLNRGPVIAVNSNDRLDYFGRTVNLAARLHGESHGDDIVVAKSICDDPTIKKLIEDRKASTEDFVAALKGIRDPQDLVRIRL